MALLEGAQEKFEIPSENSALPSVDTLPSSSWIAGAISDLIAIPPARGTVQKFSRSSEVTTSTDSHAQTDSLLPSGCHTAVVGASLYRARTSARTSCGGLPSSRVT